jgi:membrane-bound serine protease (ClpP class)
MLLGVTMLVAEAFVTSYGLLFAGGLLLFLLGGSMIFDMPAVSDLDVSFWSVLVPAAGGFALFAGLVILAVGRVIRRPQVSGVGELMGQVGTAVTPLEPEGTVFVRGEHWKARAESPLAQGERVEVTAVHDLTLRVRRAEPLD